MPKKRNFLQSERTLAEFGIELMATKSLQNNQKMLLMLFFTLRVD
jgi:dynactin complex subunit